MSERGDYGSMRYREGGFDVKSIGALEPGMKLVLNPRHKSKLFVLKYIINWWRRRLDRRGAFTVTEVKNTTFTLER